MRSDFLENNSGQSNVLAKVANIDAAVTLTAADSGTTFMLGGSGAYTITLPTSLDAGLVYEFYVKEDTPNGAITIAAGSAIVDGVVASGDAITAKIETTGGTAVSNVIIGITAKQGSYLKFVCDGVSWYFSGGGTPDDWITTS